MLVAPASCTAKWKAARYADRSCSSFIGHEFASLLLVLFLLGLVPCRSNGWIRYIDRRYERSVWLCGNVHTRLSFWPIQYDIRPIFCVPLSIRDHQLHCYFQQCQINPHSLIGSIDNDIAQKIQQGTMGQSEHG
jgi:hypothetical protein